MFAGFAFSGLIFGELLGTLAPWADHTRIGPIHLAMFAKIYFSIVAVQVFFVGSLFFMVLGARTDERAYAHAFAVAQWSATAGLFLALVLAMVIARSPRRR